MEIILFIVLLPLIVTGIAGLLMSGLAILGCVFEYGPKIIMWGGGIILLISAPHVLFLLLIIWIALKPTVTMDEKVNDNPPLPRRNP